MSMHTTVRGAFPIQRFAGKAIAASSRRQNWQWPLPMNSIVAVLDQSIAARDFVRSLAAEPFDVSIEAVSGSEGAGAIHAAFERQGILDRLVSHLNGEDEVSALLESEAQRGATILLITVDPEHFPTVLSALHRYRPDFVETNGRWIRSSVAAGQTAAAA